MHYTVHFRFVPSLFMSLDGIMTKGVSGGVYELRTDAGDERGCRPRMGALGRPGSNDKPDCKAPTPASLIDSRGRHSVARVERA